MAISRGALRTVAFFVLLFCHRVLWGQSVATPLPATVQASTDEQAHALLDSALKVNGLFSDDLKPWHMTATVTRIWHEPKPVPQKVDVWSAGRYKSRSSVESEGKRSVNWTTSRTQRYHSLHFYNPPWEPFSNSLDLAGYLRPGIELQMKHIEVGVSLDCVSVSHPERYPKSVGRAFYPSLCFDKKMRLRLLSFGQVVTEYDSYRTFQGREVAGHAKVAAHGDTLTEAKLDSLEAIDKLDGQILTPDPDAIKDIFNRHPGDPEPVVIHQEAGATYLAAGKVRPNVLVLISAILQTDGSVKVPKNGAVSYRQADGQITLITGTADAIENNLSSAPRLEPMIAAAGRWKFEPYEVDGRPLEVWINVPFTEDGKPWNP